MTIALTYSQLLLQCLDESLEVAAFPAPAHSMLRGGEAVRPSISISDDECCSGLAWVRIVNVDPRFTRDDFPSQCVNHLRVATLEMGVARCMPTPDATAMVTADQWNEVVARMESDHSAMEAALCCFQALGAEITGSPDLYPGQYVPFGPEGRCIGGTLQLTIEHACACGTAG